VAGLRREVVAHGVIPMARRSTGDPKISPPGAWLCRRHRAGRFRLAGSHRVRWGGMGS
jgi:hypothetical protein